MVITIDGPAGSGKSSVSQLVAKQLNAAFLDTGAMYRAVTVAAMNKDLDLENSDSLIEVLQSSKFDFKINGQVMEVTLDGNDITEDIRKLEVTNNVKHIASNTVIRSELVRLQRQFAEKYDMIVTEGRDQGTVAFPDAEMKFFLTANIAERARRRHCELKEKGQDVDFEQLQGDIAQRDASDQNRQTAPLTAAADAVNIDTSNLDINQVVDKLLDIIKTR